MRKKFFDIILCSFVVSLLWLLCGIYLKYVISKNCEPIFGFGFLIMFTYVILVIFFALRGCISGIITFFYSFFSFFLLCFFVALYNHTKISIIDFLKTQLLIPFSLITLISGIVAGLITSIFKKKKVAIFVGVGLFYILSIIAAFMDK